MSLIAAELESRGIATVSFQFLEYIARIMGPPRALLVPFPHGRTLGNPGDRVQHMKTLRAALALFKVKAHGQPILETLV